MHNENGRHNSNDKNNVNNTNDVCCLTLSTVAKAPFCTACPAGYDGCVGEPFGVACATNTVENSKSTYADETPNDASRSSS